MNTRQAIRAMTLAFLLGSLCGCAAPSAPAPATTTYAPPPIASATAYAAPPTATLTASPPSCAAQAGQTLQDVVSETVPPQEFIIYLPPCYAESAETYPALYLLHGQTFNQDQWIRLGAASIADALIQSSEAPPFIMVFPDDHYWNAPAGAEFGNRLIYNLIPYVDAHYRTRNAREFRALGGLSRGGGWTAQLGFSRPDVFGALGLHSPAFFKDNAPYLERYIRQIPVEQRPHLWMDIGEADTLLGDSLLFEDTLTRNDYVHVFHRFSGDHSERYWSKHAEAYLRWYASHWITQ
ncbi:MAG: hypothetical protein Fur002_04090 [Anaerolineales bacterium]